jgi:hypothetical protein
MQDEARGRLSVGTFQPTPTGSIAMVTASPVRLAEATLFGVTMLGRPGEVGIDTFVSRIT